MSLEPFLARHAAEMIGFTVESYLELRSLLVQNHTTHRIFGHYFFLDLMEKCASCLLSLTVKKKKKFGKQIKLNCKLNTFAEVFA